MGGVGGCVGQGVAGGQGGGGGGEGVVRVRVGRGAGGQGFGRQFYHTFTLVSMIVTIREVV